MRVPHTEVLGSVNTGYARLMSNPEDGGPGDGMHWDTVGIRGDGGPGDGTALGCSGSLRGWGSWDWNAFGQSAGEMGLQPKECHRDGMPRR